MNPHVLSATEYFGTHYCLQRSDQQNSNTIEFAIMNQKVCSGILIVQQKSFIKKIEDMDWETNEGELEKISVNLPQLVAGGIAHN
jgi:hypothetical protein